VGRQLCSPPVWRGLQQLKAWFRGARLQGGTPCAQDLDVYSDPRMAETLEQWGEGTAWNEIQLLMADRCGRALDIACGTGKVMRLLARYRALEVHGCDISAMLIAKAVGHGIPRERLVLADATAMSYPDNAFDWGYSIGSLEHFTEQGITNFLRECHRVVRGGTFHMIPVARDGHDHGWIKTTQSYHNNSVGWWEPRCRAIYARVHLLDSSWADQISVGKWLICEKASSARATPSVLR
jgi:SAM-dependent methyltransferase